MVKIHALILALRATFCCRPVCSDLGKEEPAAVNVFSAVVSPALFPLHLLTHHRLPFRYTWWGSCFYYYHCYSQGVRFHPLWRSITTTITIYNTHLRLRHFLQLLSIVPTITRSTTIVHIHLPDNHNSCYNLCFKLSYNTVRVSC